MTNSPMRSHGTAFAPLPTWQEEEEPPTPQPHYNQVHAPYGPAASMYSPHEPRTGSSTYNMGGQAAAEPRNFAPTTGHGAEWPIVATPIADAHMRSGSNELDDFSHGYTAAVGHIRNEDDRQPLTISNPDDSGSEAGSPGRSTGERPLWQQNRRQSRNLMWM